MRRIGHATNRGSGGFTLLEVLVAMALLGLAIVPLLGTFGQSLRMAESSKRVTQATLIARETMTYLELESFPELGETEGDFLEQEDRPEAQDFRWRQTVLPPPAGLDEQQVREVRLEILWDEGSVERSYEVVDFIVRRGA